MENLLRWSLFTFNTSIILKLSGHVKGWLKNFLKNLLSGLKIIHQFGKVDRNVYITANKSAPIHANQILLSSNWLEVSPWSFTHVFKKIETTMRWNCTSKALRLVQIIVEHQDRSFFTLFLTIKTSSQNISITLLQISLKLHEHQGGYCMKKLPVPWNTAASKIGNGVILLLWQLQCHCIPDHNKVSSLSNTTVVLISPNLCLWRRSLHSNLGGIDPEKLYGATLNVLS